MKLWNFERRWAREVAHSFVAPGALAGVVDHVDVGAEFARDCEESPTLSALPIRLALWLVWFWPFPRTFGGLSAEAREALLERLLKSRIDLIRLMVVFLKLICMSLALGDVRALKQVGAYRLRVLPPGSERQAS
jgi:hypothetical protein